MIPWVAITGGIGSGKSTAAAFFVALGVPLIDADDIAREITAPRGEAIPVLARAFGDEYVDLSGSLKRDAMRALILSDAGAKKKLEDLLHPIIFHRIKKDAAQCRGVYGMLAIPLLAEAPAFRVLVQRVLAVDCPESLQIERVMERSAMSRREAEMMVAAQASRRQRLRLADDIIDNSGDLIALKQKVAALHSFYTEFFHG